MARRSSLESVISHWHHLIDNLQTSPQEFYAAVEAAILERKLPETYKCRVFLREGRFGSGQREYLRFQRHEHCFDICAAPFGTGFFVSWWLTGVSGCAAGCLVMIPLIGALFADRGPTYYEIDTALMFQEVVRRSILNVIDDLTKAQGLRALSEDDRKPILREFYKR